MPCYLGNASINIANGRPVGGGEVAVDASDDLIDFLLQVLVLLDVSSRRHGYLHENHLQTSR